MTAPPDSADSSVPPDRAQGQSASASSSSGQVLTPEALGEWLVGQQREFFSNLLNASQAENPELPPPLNLSVEALMILSSSAYALQVAIVTFTYHQFLDDTAFFADGNKGRVEMLRFLTRIQSSAREVSAPYAKVDTPQFDPFPIAGCIVDIKGLLPQILMYYSSLFGGFLEPLARAQPEAAKFAQGQIEGMKMKTINPFVEAMALAYFFAFRQSLTSGGRVPFPDPRKPDIGIVSTMLRTWVPWFTFISTFQDRLFAFAGGRTCAFT